MCSNEGLGWIEIRIFVLYTKDQEVECNRCVVEAAQVAEHQTPVQNVAGSNTSVSLRPKNRPYTFGTVNSCHIFWFWVSVWQRTREAMS